MGHKFRFLFVLAKKIFRLTETVCAKRSLILKGMMVFLDRVQFLVD